MLSGVFRFVFPDLSSHFVLRDLLRSFRLERPLPSSRVPPWDLARVLSFLRFPPFEPLSSCCLRDLTWKVLFLVSLATARRVGELQAVSAEVSSSGDDLFLTYLSEFRAKSESSARSFSVRSLRDFVGDLPEELLLCPVRALRLYLSHTASLPSRPRTLCLSSVPLSSSFQECPQLFHQWKRILRRVCPFLPCPCLLLPFLPLLPVLALLFARMGFVGWLLLGLFSVMLL